MKNRMLPHVSEILFGGAWAIEPGKLAVLVDVFARRRAGLAADGMAFDEDREEAEEDRRVVTGATVREVRGFQVNQIGRVAVLPMFGTIVHRASTFSRYSGGVSAEQFVAAHEELVADPAVSAIVWNVHSPGGSTAGVPEAGDRLFAVRGKKKTVAVSNTMNASAAYWLSSAADEIVATPSSLTGSIGVFAVHEDYSAANDKAGVRVTYVSAGKYKTDGHQDAPISDTARASMQRRVDDYYGQFVAAVARNRRTTEAAIRGGYGEGEVLTAKRAVEAGLADRVDTLDGVIRSFGASMLAAPGGQALQLAEARQRAAGIAI